MIQKKELVQNKKELNIKKSREGKFARGFFKAKNI